MTLAADDLGVLGNLAVALGVFDGDGDPNPDWFGAPQDSLATMLGNETQRDALISFVDEALGGEEREADAYGVMWLPIVSLDDPDLDVSITIDASKNSGVDIGIGLAVGSTNPTTRTTLSIPLFRTKNGSHPMEGGPVLLGQPGGRIRIATEITVDAGAAVPGEAHLGSIALDVDVPTSPLDPVDPVFGLALGSMQLPGATTSRDLRISADGVDELDDALLDLVLSLVKAQADAAGGLSPALGAVAGLLGLTDGDDVPDFPITEIPTAGVHALAAWVHGILTTTAARNDWLGYLADLIGGTRVGDAVSFVLGGSAALTLGLRVDTGPTGNARVTPSLGVELGNTTARVEARAELFHLDLVSGAATALPSLGVWAAAGGSAVADRILDVSAPVVARADVLRVGFALDAARRVTFVLAADGVVLGDHEYPTLDLTSPNAVMDAVGNTVADVAEELLGNLGGAVDIVRLLIGLDAPTGVDDVTLVALMTDPLGAVRGYWLELLTGPAAATAVAAVLGELRGALADTSVAATAIHGAGTPADPWRLALIGPLELELSIDGDVAAAGLAAVTRVDDLGQQCTVVETRIAARLAEIDLAAGSASLLPAVEAVLSARERGVNPPTVHLALAGGASITASGVGIRLGWTPGGGLRAGAAVPDLALRVGAAAIPITLPEIAADGSVSLPPEGWDAIEVLVGHLGDVVGGTVGEIVRGLGWSASLPSAGGDGGPVLGGRLRLADLVDDPVTALLEWLPAVVLSELGPQVLSLVADLLAGAGSARGLLDGSGHPDDPLRLPLGAGVPNLAVWFPPAGLEPRLVAAPDAIRAWRPGDPGLAPAALAQALGAEATVAADVRALVDGRDVATALGAITTRWSNGDGLIVPPGGAVPGVSVVRDGHAAGQLRAHLDIEDLLGRVPTTIVHVALGAAAFPDAPAGRRVDLSTPGLTAAMFTLPAVAAGEWFVALGRRDDCRPAGSASDGTPEQAARLARLVEALCAVDTDVVLVPDGGAGHAARAVAEATAGVTALVTLGTPLSAISLTALSTQPTADALRLLHRLLPAPASGEDEHLALGRSLVTGMIELTASTDPGVDLRPPLVPPPAPRAGLEVVAVFGSLTTSQVQQAITAIVVAGLAERARVRAAVPLPDPTGVEAGVMLAIPPSTAGSLAVTGDARLTLASYDRTTGVDTSRTLRVRVRVGDRAGYLTSTPGVELRAVSADVTVPLDGTSPGTATVTLHDARLFGQSWEALVLGGGPGASPVLPEARTLLAVLVQRLVADVTSAESTALADLLDALAIIAPTGGVAADAIDQLVLDPGGLVRARLAAAETAVTDAIDALLGPIALAVDLEAGQVVVEAGDTVGGAAGRFGWATALTVGESGVTGNLRLGPATPSPTAGGLQLHVQLAPLRVHAEWHRPGGAVDTVELWPAPDPAAIARALVAAAPSLGGHVALELLRRADEGARPTIDAALDAFGLLGGVATDADRSLRPLTGLLADPAAFLRGADSLATNPGKIQGLFDALRPLLGVGGDPGSPIPLASGVSLAVGGAGSATRLDLVVDPTAWTAPGGGGARLAAGVGASLTIGPSGPPEIGLAVHVGLEHEIAGRQAVHVTLGSGGIAVFLRPTTGPDIPLLPFAGLGSLAAVAEAALPFLLDRLAEQDDPVGPLVTGVGNALALRTGSPTPDHFDGARLQAWAADPVGQLQSAALSIAQVGLATLADLVDDFLPATVDAGVNGDAVEVTIGAVTLSWAPDSGAVGLSLDGVAVPGIDQVSAALIVDASGLQELSVTVGPATIDTGSVLLRPFVTVAAGLAPAGGRRVAAGLAVDDTHHFAARWLLEPSSFALVATDGDLLAPTEFDEPDIVALRLIEVVADVVAAVALSTDAVDDLLGTTIGATTVRNLLRGVVLDDADPANLIDGLFDLDTLLARVQRLVANLAGAGLTVTFEGLTLSLLDQGGTLGLQLGLAERVALVEGSVSLWLETDDSWIDPNPPGSGGVFVGVLNASAPFTFKPMLAINGVGLRIGSANGPLLESVITIESIAVHGYAEFTLAGARSGGGQIQFTNLAVAPGGGGENGIAQGVMRDTGPTPPKPAFSPALAIQKHGSQPVDVTLRAGVGDGPWWIAIRRGFGPLYLEQIGFGVGVANHRVERVSLLMDGSVSMFGLTCAVDDLQITYLISNGDFFDPDSWIIDLAGLAVSADMAGLSIAGGLLKQETPQGIEYLGMLLARFGVYGITIFGGYGEGDDNGTKFTAFFAVGAVNGPIGGPPAFFLTGIGGGFGINRELIVPTDLSRFGDYPLIQALDIAATPQDPMEQLRSLGAYFPMKRGTFWFAAGLSFNSFALVDGIAVVAVEVGDGLDINLLGLARMALPRPQAAIVSIELALLCRFSSSEGVLWVQAQLTDNSWLLYEDVRLTGGFAYVMWFKGEHRGEFVLTIGGYHPDFHRDGYPVVPRLGVHWEIGDYIVIEAGGYFALTSEAVMAGGDFHASAELGPAWADVRFGAHGIIYFDPFRYQVEAYARISAGVTIDTWLFGEITISVSLGARVEVEGPEFHGRATFEVGPVELEVEFGDTNQTRKELLGATDFIAKYLDPGDGNGALVHAAIVSAGALPANGEQSTPDGSAARPYVVVVEFGMTFTSAVPAGEVQRINASSGALTTHSPSKALGVAPMGTSNVTPRLVLAWHRDGVAVDWPFIVTARPHGAFPAGIWGPPQPDENRKVPKAEMIEALHELDLVSRATPSGGGPTIPYHQVEINDRKPLPFSRTTAQVIALKNGAAVLAGLVEEPTTVAAAFGAASTFLASTATPTTLASLRGERQAPPRLGTLGEGLDTDAITVVPGIGVTPPGKVYDHFVDAPIAIGLLAGTTVDVRSSTGGRTTVKDAGRLWKQAPPTLASVEALRSKSIATRLVVREPAAVPTVRGAIRGRSRRAARSTGTVIGADRTPPTAVAHGPAAIVRTAGGPGQEHLDGFTSALTAGRRTGSGNAGATLSRGQTVVLRLPNAAADVAGKERPALGVTGAPARVVVVGHGGAVMTDRVVSGIDGDDEVTIDQGAERIVAVGQGAPATGERAGTTLADIGLAGWHAGSQLPYVGWSSALGPGCVVRGTGDPLKANRERHDAGWLTGAELAKGLSTVTTTFSEAVTTVVVIVDDPAAFGDPVGGRTLLLGLDGAARATQRDGTDRPPVLLVAENRSIVAYEIVPDGTKPVSVTVSSDLGWSLAGIMGAPGTSAAAAIAHLSARGLDAGLRPLAPGGTGTSRLGWLGATRNARQRRQAQALASNRPTVRLAAAGRTRPPAPTRPARKPPGEKPARRRRAR